MNKIY